MERIELPHVACFDLAEGLSNQKVQECSRGCGCCITAAEFFEGSSSPTISPSSSSSSSLGLGFLVFVWSSVLGLSLSPAISSRGFCLFVSGFYFCVGTMRG